MGLFSIFKRDEGIDPDMTLLRDLIVIGASDSDYSLTENEHIVSICHKLGIPAKKLKKVFSMDPDRIKDVYPNTPQGREEYVIQLIDVMAADAVCKTREIQMLYHIADKMHYTHQQVDDLVRAYCKQVGGKRGERILDSFLENR